MYTDETTDYQLEIDAGDEVSVVARTSRGALVKKNGLLGWYFGTLEDITENKKEYDLMEDKHDRKSRADCP